MARPRVSFQGGLLSPSGGRRQASVPAIRCISRPVSPARLAALPRPPRSPRRPAEVHPPQGRADSARATSAALLWPLAAGARERPAARTPRDGRTRPKPAAPKVSPPPTRTRPSPRLELVAIRGPPRRPLRAGPSPNRRGPGPRRSGAADEFPAAVPPVRSALRGDRPRCGRCRTRRPRARRHSEVAPLPGRAAHPCSGPARRDRRRLTR